MTLKLLEITNLMKKLSICHKVCNIAIDFYYVRLLNLQTTSGLLVLIHDFISLPDWKSYDNVSLLYFTGCKRSTEKNPSI